MRNLDKKTVKSFGDEWVHFDQSGIKNKEAYEIFKSYFSIFPFLLFLELIRDKNKQ